MILDEAGLRALIADAVREVLREELGRGAPADYLDVASAARVAAVSPATIRAWIREGKLGSYRAGRELRVKRPELDALLAAPPDAPEIEPEALAIRSFSRRRTG